MRTVPNLLWPALLLLVLAGCSSTLDPEPPSNVPPTVMLNADQLDGEATFDVVFETDASDPNGDPLSYTWLVNGVRDTSATGPLATLTFSEAGTFAVSVEVTDGWRTTTAQTTVNARNEFRPVESPDIAVIGFAGRRCPVGCGAPDTNQAALGVMPDPGTLNAIAGAFERLDYSVETFSFRSHLLDRVPYGDGYLTAEAVLRFVQDEWISDFLDPTRIVLVAHSHGTQFMSLLAYDHPEIQSAYGIYLDAVCTLWDSDHVKSGLFDGWYGSPASYPAPLDETTYACDSLPVDGVASLQDISDVVPWNVTWGLEVRSGSIPFDANLNVRPGGAMGADVGLAGVREEDEAHTMVHRAGSAGLSWVLDMIALNGLPSAVGTSQISPALHVAPPPPGFELDSP